MRIGATKAFCLNWPILLAINITIHTGLKWLCSCKTCHRQAYRGTVTTTVLAPEQVTTWANGHNMLTNSASSMTDPGKWNYKNLVAQKSKRSCQSGQVLDLYYHIIIVIIIIFVVVVVVVIRISVVVVIVVAAAGTVIVLVVVIQSNNITIIAVVWHYPSLSSLLLTNQLSICRIQRFNILIPKSTAGPISLNQSKFYPPISALTFLKVSL